MIQFGLVLTTFIFKRELEILPYIVSFFALFLLTTVGIHRLFMESKNRFIKEQKDDLLLTYYDLHSYYDSLFKEYESQSRLLKDVIKDNELLFSENNKLKQKIVRKKS